jgi:hypothetical protein
MLQTAGCITDVKIEDWPTACRPNGLRCEWLTLGDTGMNIFNVYRWIRVVLMCFMFMGTGLAPRAQPIPPKCQQLAGEVAELTQQI